MIPSLPAPYSLIYSDVPATRNLTLGPTPSKPITLYWYAFVVEGPCPRVWSVSAYLYRYPGAPLRGVNIGVTMNSSLTQRRRSSPVNIYDDLFWDAVRNPLFLCLLAEALPR